MNQATKSLHASITQIMAEMKGLATHVTSLSKRQDKHGEKINQILTYIEGFKSQFNKLKATVSEGVGVHLRKLSGGSRSIFNKHPLLKMCHNMLNIACAVYAEDISLWCIQFFFRCVEWSGPDVTPLAYL